MLRFIVRNGAVLDEPANITYDPGEHVHWRIAQQGATVLFQTSADGVQYVTRRTATPAWALTALTAQMYAYYDGVGAQPRDAIIDTLTFEPYAAGWTLYPTRSAADFPNGAASWIVPPGGSQYQTTGANLGNLAQYGDTIRMVFRSDVDATIDLKASVVGGGQVDQNTYTIIPANAPTAIDWQPPAGTLANVGYLGFYVTDAATVQLDRVQVGGGLTGAEIWEDASNQTVQALRALNDTKLILVSGYEWSSVQNWLDVHPDPWVEDDNVRYEAHHYFDTESSSDGAAASSVYEQTYASAVADSRGIAAYERAAALHATATVAIASRRVHLRSAALAATVAVDTASAGQQVYQRAAALAASVAIDVSWEPPGPANLTAVVTHNRVALTWNEVADAVSYELVRDGEPLGSVS
jgi:hypothetical protein